MRSNKLNRKHGGSKIFDGNQIIETDEIMNGNPFFKKIFYFSEPPKEREIISSKNEKEIAKILMDNPHPNIATIYEVNDKYVVMEELDTNGIIIEEIIEPMLKVKTFLQNLGIMYIDWKIDNIGKDLRNGTYKLFDFDASGLVYVEKRGEWILKPYPYFNYRMALEGDYKTPEEIDNWVGNYSYKVADAMMEARNDNK
jgi:hypothetical protein